MNLEEFSIYNYPTYIIWHAIFKDGWKYKKIEVLDIFNLEKIPAFSFTYSVLCKDEIYVKSSICLSFYGSINSQNDLHIVEI